MDCQLWQGWTGAQGNRRLARPRASSAAEIRPGEEVRRATLTPALSDGSPGNATGAESWLRCVRRARSKPLNRCPEIRQAISGKSAHGLRGLQDQPSPLGRVARKFLRLLEGSFLHC